MIFFFLCKFNKNRFRYVVKWLQSQFPKVFKQSAMILIRSCSATQPRILKPLGAEDISNVGSHLLFKMSQDQQNLFSKGIYGLDFLNKNAEKIAAADKKDFLRNDGKYLYLDFMSVGKVLPGNEMKPDICLQQIPRACLRLELG